MGAEFLKEFTSQYGGTTPFTLPVPMSTFVKEAFNEDDIRRLAEVYDFDGDEQLCFHEIWKMVKHKLYEYRKSLGGGYEIDVPTSTPEEKGYNTIRVLASGGQG